MGEAGTTMKTILSLLLALPLAGCLSADTAEVSSLHDYNYVVGTQTFGSKYQFTEEPRLVETAQEIHAMGSNVIKFRLEPSFHEDNYSGGDPGEYASLKELASGDDAIRTVLEMPFTYYFFWGTPMQACSWQDDDGYTRKDAETEYREIHDLATHLLTTYAGTGKKFYFGNWEGDWLLLKGFDRTKNPARKDIRNMIKWANNRQQAVEDARRDTDVEDVAVYHYIELVLVEKGIRGLPCIATEVLPHTNVDYVSYSAYEMQNDYDLPKAMDRVLGFIEEKLPPKPEIPGPRVFIGEFGRQGNTVGPEAQRDHAVEFIQAGLQWGSPFILWWQLYGNEVEDGHHRGYWLIDDKGKEWPLYHTLRDYFLATRSHLVESIAQGALPSAGDFRNKAVELIDREARFAGTKWVKEERIAFEKEPATNWKTAGDEVSLVKGDPAAGGNHLHLSADGQPTHWSAASLVRKAVPGEVWQAEIKAKRLSGPLLRLKIVFQDGEGNKLRILSRTAVESKYVPVAVSARAPEGTTEVHIVLAVEYGSREDPVAAVMDDLVLRTGEQ